MYVRADRRLKPTELEGDAIDAWRKLEETIVAVDPGHGGHLSNLQSGTLQRDGDARHRPARFIGDLANEAR